MAKAEKKKMKWYYKLIIIVLSVILAGTALLAGIGVMVYEQFFGIRYETYAPYAFHTGDFEGLMCADYEFTSDAGQKLAGYLYHRGDGEAKGLIVFAHGLGGGGHNSYMDGIAYMVQNGYYVFAYDVTGNDNSEGDSVKGLPQGIIDLRYALEFLDKQEEFYHLPVMLIGHSWGGYSVTNVLNYYPDVNAVVSMAGFDTATDLIKAQGEDIAGEKAMSVILPVMKAYESIKFGDYAESSAMNGFANSDAAVMVIHSDDDTTVPQKYGYDIWYESYKDDPRFIFVQLTGQGHNDFLNGEDRNVYTKEFNAELEKYKNSLPEDITEDNSEQLEIDYISKNLDRERWSNGINKELFDEIIAFFDANLD